MVMNDIVLFSGMVILFVVVAVLLFNNTMRSYKKWADWVDFNFPFMSDQEVRDYVDKHLVDALIKNCSCKDCTCKDKDEDR